MYLDPYGYVIGLEEIDPVTNYLFLTGIDSNASYLGTRTADATAIFLDGRIESIEVNVRDSDDELTATSGTGAIQHATTDGTSAAHNFALVNAWFSYSVDSNGVYTLRYVDNQNAINVGSTDVTIDRTHITLAKSGSGYAVGNDETVYLNVGIEDGVALPGGGSDTATIIDSVDSITTGARNVDLIVSNKSGGSDTYRPFQEIYVLYNSSNWIIGVVTIDAEDQGASSSYAYVSSSDVKSERYNSTTGLWTWVREVVINGELTDITYTSDSSIGIIEPGSSNLGRRDTQMDQGYWYKVTYYADGTVKDVEALYDYFDHDVTTGGSADNSDEYIAHTEEIEDTYTTADPDVAVLWMSAELNAASKNDYPTANRITFNEQGSVYTYDTDRTGFSVSPDVKVVVINAGGSSQSAFYSVEDGYEGYSGLRAAIRDLNGNFQGDVSAILEGGIATSIIFNCTAPDTGFDEGEDTPSGDAYSSVVDRSAEGLSLLNFGGSSFDSANDLATSDYMIANFNQVAAESLSTQVREYLTYLGYTEIGRLQDTGDVDGSSNDGYFISAVDPDGIEVTVGLPDSAISLIYKVTIDGDETYVDSTDHLDDIGLTGHVRVVSSGVTSTVINGDRGTTAIVDGASYTSNAYTRVTVNTSVTSGQGNTFTASVALTSGTGYAVTANSWLLERGAVLTVTVTPSSSTTAAENITGSCSETGLAFTTASFGVSDSTARTFTITVNTDGDATATTRTVTIVEDV